ncbi:hypothetical protein ACMYSQ_006280 [Aspergillus niger]
MALAYGALSEELLLSILEYHMDSAWEAARSTQTCHTVVGIRSAQDFHRQSFPLGGFMAHPLLTPLWAIAGSRTSGRGAGFARVARGNNHGGGGKSRDASHRARSRAYYGTVSAGN